jgi:hypothetical protein
MLLEDNFEQFGDVHNLTDEYSWHDVLEVLSAVVVSVGNIEVELLFKLVLSFLFVTGVCDPGLNQGSPLVTIIIGNVQNTST